MKKLVIVLLVAAALLSLVCCGKGDETESTSQTESEAKEMTTETQNETSEIKSETVVSDIKTDDAIEETTERSVVTDPETTADEIASVATEAETDITTESETDDNETEIVTDSETETETAKAIETETTSSETVTTEAETEVDTTASENYTTETELVTESDTETESETESEAEPEPDTVYPNDGSTVVLANAEVYGWWDTYKFNKTDSDPFYRHEDIYYPVPLIFSWDKGEDADYYRLYISTNEDLLPYESYLINNNSISLDHLFTGTKYYWTVISTKVVDGNEINETVVPTRSFTTAESPRCLRIEGVSNTRDIGGLEAIDGYRIKQGMIYRGGKLEKITEAGKDFFVNYIGIKTDLDLRTPGEGGAGSGSPLGSDINYVNINGRYYIGNMGIQSEEGKKVFADEIRLFANPDNYPIYIHCSLGRDRTGTLAFVIEALLGVSRNDMYMDYELSVFSVTGTLDNAGVQAIRKNIVTVYNYLDTFEGSNLAEKTENYLLSIGITAEEIQTIRDLLLEEVK